MRKQDRTQLLRIAGGLPSGDPVRRAVLASLLKVAMEHSSKEEMEKYLKDHPGADPNNHTVKKKEESKGGESEEETKKETQSFLSKLKGVKDSVKKSLTEAPAAVQKIFTDPATRKKALGDVVATIKKSPEKISDAILESAKKELGDMKTAVGAFGKVLKKPIEQWDKEDYKAVYSAASYVVGGVLAASGGGPLMAAAAVGKSFAMHVGVKALSEIADTGLLHYEWAETAAHYLGHLHLAKEEEIDNDALEKSIFQQLTVAVTKVLDKGLTDKDMEDILVQDEGPGEDKLVQPKPAKKPAGKGKQARESLIRLAAQMEMGTEERKTILKMLK